MTRDKPNEYWKRDKNFIQRARINFMLWFMKFQRQTHGLGMLFLLFMVIILGSSIISLITTLLDNDRHNLEDFEKRVICMKHGSCIWGV